MATGIAALMLATVAVYAVGRGGTMLGLRGVRYYSTLGQANAEVLDWLSQVSSALLSGSWFHL
ncbi:hypothetical protein [Saccharopolyspora sp. ASAGF58]|uniref:hypothetical protein n=1 Tax=Saccharopolyspora sp. ASAGF58 TaxID=2719023 RepID=UPI0014401497|nr:hypothetical protein [Saccharopolyspora sp. ASAGF58]QIZ38589.1 hypothetical protein FDZ84_33760 [Saccharopolyspora sp. ASAGF58]